VATVSRFINHNAPISDEIGIRLQSVMDELGYVPLEAARHLATHKTGLIGLLSFTVEYGFFGPLVAGLEEAMKENGYNLLIATYSPECKKDEIAPPVGPHNTDGVVVFSDTLSEAQLAEWYRMQFPVVLIYRTSPASLPIPCVNVENKKSAYKLVEHLIEAHDRRRIVFVRAPGCQEDAHWREMGYKAALKDHSIAFDPKLIVDGKYDRRLARETMKAFLVNHPPRFDAVFAGDDDLAVSVVSALQEAGLQVPCDVAVVGFDDQRFASLLVPSLTTIHAPTENVGRMAGQQMLKILHGQPVDQRVVLPTGLVIRQSCGCAI